MLSPVNKSIRVKSGSESSCASLRTCLDTRPITSSTLMSLHTSCLGTERTAKFLQKGLTPQGPQSHGFNPPASEHQHVLFGPPGSQEATVNCETIAKWQLLTTGSANVCVGWSNTLARNTENSGMLCVGSKEYCRGRKGPRVYEFYWSLFIWLTFILSHHFWMKPFGQYWLYFALFFCHRIIIKMDLLLNSVF